MNDEQTLFINSSHPQDLFPSHKSAPRNIISNGLVIPNYYSKELYKKYHAMGTTMYEEMTAVCCCYIGP
jgi:urocanate hydratase